MFGLILSHLAATIGAIRTVSDIFLLALITIAFEVYSDAVLTRGRVSRTVADPVTMAIAHGTQTRLGPESRPADLASSGRYQARGRQHVANSRRAFPAQHRRHASRF